MTKPSPVRLTTPDLTLQHMGYCINECNRTKQHSIDRENIVHFGGHWIFGYFLIAFPSWMARLGIPIEACFRRYSIRLSQN